PGFRYMSAPSGPSWEWVLSEPTGTLLFAVRAQRQRGIELQWSWKSPAFRRVPLQLKVRPFFAMRGLHSVGGQKWMLEMQDPPAGTRVRARAESEESPLQDPVYSLLSGKWSW